MVPSKRFQQGLFTPKNPYKYVGDVSKIRYMSSYEYEMDCFLDGNERVLRWSSEPVAIPYIKPTDGRMHKYLPDYWVEYINKDGEVLQEVLEIKPHSQTKTPRKNHKHATYEQMTFAVNQAKWVACTKWCADRGIKFRIITERSIFT